MPHRFGWALLAIVVAGFALTLFRIGRFSYWLDEILQAYWISGDWAYFWKSLRFDAVHPPLDYVVDKLFESLHPSDAARKVLPAIWGAGGVSAVGVLLARRGGPVLGLAGAALLACAPYHVRFAQELRPYSLALFLISLALLCLDRFLERPGVARWLMLYAACLATAYTLYTAAVVLAIAGGALLLEDAFAPEPPRRRATRRFLAWSPVFALGLFLAYIPWWPVVVEAMRRPPFVPRSPLTLGHASRVAAFFTLAPDDGAALSPGSWLVLILIVAGAALAALRPGLRFLVAWGLGGLASIEVLSQLHPHFEASRRYLPAGPALTALAGVALATVLSRRPGPVAGAALLAVVLWLDARSLRVYFREGRPDWRPVADYLRREARPTERILTENAHTQLCVAFYLVGPHWLDDALAGRDPGRSVVNLDGEPARLASAWRPGTRAWLVLAAGPEHPALRQWAASYPERTFPSAGSAIVRRLDPAVAPER